MAEQETAMVRGSGEALETALKDLAAEGWRVSALVGCRCCDAVVILVRDKEAK